MKLLRNLSDVVAKNKDPLLFSGRINKKNVSYIISEVLYTIINKPASLFLNSGTLPPHYENKPIQI